MIVASLEAAVVTEPLTLQSLPLFPLGTVLFPGGELPLRIFEVRYLDMIRRCQEAGSPFGVVSLTQGREVRQAGASQEAMAAVGTLAALREVVSPQPGLLIIRAEGAQRFRLRRHEQLKHGLWVGDVELIADDMAVTVPPDLQDTSERLELVLEKLRAQSPDGVAALVAQQPWHLQDCGWVANRWCELLPLAPALKQRLMELDNPLLRLELVSDILGSHGIAGANA